MTTLLQRTVNDPGNWVVAGRNVLNLLDADGFRREIEDLEKLPVKGKQVPLDQIVPGFDVFIERQVKHATDGIIGIIGDAVAVGCQDKEKIQKK